MIGKQFSKLKINYLKDFFSFLLANNINEATKETLKLAREKELPLLDLFTNLSEEQFLTMSRTSLEEFLKSVIEDKVGEKQEENILKWKSNALENIPQNKVQLFDLIIINNIRKLVFLKNITSYTTDADTIVAIVTELEELYTFIEYISVNAYVEINEGDLKRLNLGLKEFHEELQVINEELKESHEELQATNEELREQIKIRSEIEEELEKERNYLRAILQNISDGIVACDEYGILTFFNAATKSFHGMDELSVPSKDWAKYYNLFHADGITPMSMEEVPLFKAYRGEEVRNIEMVIAPLNGKKRTLLATGEKIISSEGKNLGAVVVMHDITEQKISEELKLMVIAQEARLQEARRQEETVNRFFMDVPAPVAILKEKKHTFTLINKQYQNTLFPGRSLLNKPILDALPELNGTAIIEILDRVYQTGQRFVGTEVPVDLDRGKGVVERGYYNFVYEPIFALNGAPDGIFVFAYDVTDLIASKIELQNLTEDLAATNEELTAANEEIQASLDDLSATNQKLTRVNSDLDNFIYTASHDLKAPIANIEGLVVALVKSLPVDSQLKVEKMISLIVASIDRFKRTINDLTDVVKLQKEDTITEAISLTKVLEEIQQDLSQIIQESKVQFIMNNCNSFKIKYSYKNFKSIIYNLISNAIKYRSPERDLIVKITCGEEEGFQTFTIEDNGLGMDLSNDTKIFSMFKRLHNHVEGSGIGLYIVKKIIENSGGKIEVFSKVNEGSVFKVYLK